MIYGIGTDICDIRRIRASLERHGERFAQEVLAAFKATAEAALKVGLGINAGHDLNRENLPTFLTTVPGVQEVSIGHALIADALELGYTETVRAYNACMPQ